jgi:predicted nucleic acid-binding protein
VIVDTSAWVEYLRATGSVAHVTLRARIESGEAVATPAPAVMELLAGCRTEESGDRLRRLLARFEILEVEGLADFEDAALIQRMCRRGGETVRSMVDCLIAAIALRESRPLLSLDRDYERIARHVGLQLVLPG